MCIWYLHCGTLLCCSVFVSWMWVVWHTQICIILLLGWQARLDKVALSYNRDDFLNVVYNAFTSLQIITIWYLVTTMLLLVYYAHVQWLRGRSQFFIWYLLFATKMPTCTRIQIHLYTHIDQTRRDKVIVRKIVMFIFRRRFKHFRDFVS